MNQQFLFSIISEKYERLLRINKVQVVKRKILLLLNALEFLLEHTTFFNDLYWKFSIKIVFNIDSFVFVKYFYAEIMDDEQDELEIVSRLQILGKIIYLVYYYYVKFRYRETWGWRIPNRARRQ